MRNHTAAVAAAAIRALLIITLAAFVGGCPPADNNASGVGAPDAVDDGPFNIVEDSTATAIGVTANDTEPDGQALTIIAVSSPSGGTAVINGLNINYTPFADFSGNDSFTYTIRDPDFNQDTATVSITVTPENDAPEARPDSYTGESAEVLVLDVRANDVDVDGDLLTIIAVTDPAGQPGAVTTNGSTVTYTVPDGFEGQVQFTYTIQDPSALSSMTTVTVDVGLPFTLPEVLYEYPPCAKSGNALLPGNTNRLVLVFSEPIDQASLNFAFAGSVFLFGQAGGSGSASFVTGLSGLDRRILVVTPSGAFTGTPQLAVWSERSSGVGLTNDSGVFINPGHSDAPFSGFNMDPAIGFKWNGTGNDVTAPTVTLREPASASTNAGPNSWLRITFSEPVDPATLTTIIVNDSLGAVTGEIVPTLETMQTVTFRPSRALAGSVDVTLQNVRDLANNAAGAGTNYSFTVTTDQLPPVIDLLTVEQLPAILKGDPANGGGYPGTPGNGGRIDVAQTGFTIDVACHDPGGSKVSTTPGDHVVTSSGTVGGQTPGTNLAPLFGAGNVSIDDSTVTFLVPGSLSFNVGTHTISVQLRDQAGNLSGATTYTIDAVAAPAADVPFDTQTTWHLLFNRDHETTTYNFAGNDVTSPLNDSINANGTADFDDDLLGWGFRSTNGLANVNSGVVSMNNAARNFLINRVIFHLYRLYGLRVGLDDGQNNAQLLAINTPTPATTPDAADIRFVFDASDPGSSFSRMAFGGVSTTSGTLGRAVFDPQNDTNNEDDGVSTSNTDLGVFTLAQLHANFNGSAPSSANPFTLCFAGTSPFAGVTGGTPIGDSADDPFILDPQQDPSTFTAGRATRFRKVMRALDCAAMYWASVAAHEIGHSTGLTSNGAPGAGLYGNDAAFSGSTSHHINLDGLNGGASGNVMSPSVGLSEALSRLSGFNRLTNAYLRNIAVANPGN